MVRDGSHTLHPVDFFLSLIEQGDLDESDTKSADRLQGSHHSQININAFAPLPLNAEKALPRATDPVPIAPSPESFESCRTASTASSPSQSAPSPASLLEPS